MPNRVRTKDQLYTQLPDNITRLIRAADARDVVASAFGFVHTAAPNASFDKVDTLHLGAWFDTGSTLLDTTNRRFWVCFSGNALAAVWRAMMYDGQAAGGVLDGTYPSPGLVNSGVTAGSYGDSTHYATFTVDVDGRLTAAGEVTLPGGGVSSVAVNGPAGTTATGNPVTGSGTIDIDWDLVAANYVFAGPASGVMADPTLRLLVAADVPSLDAAKITSGSFDAARIPSLDASKITSGAFDAARIPSLDASKITSGEFDAARIPSLDASKITSGAFDAARIPSLDASKITSGMFSTAQIPNLSAAFITSGLFTNSALFSLDVSIITSGRFAAARMPLGVPIAGTVGPFPQWITNSLVYTQFNAAGTSNTVTLVTLPAKGVLHAIKIRLTQAFAGTGITPTYQIGFDSGGGTPASSANKYGTGGLTGAPPSLATYSTTGQPDAQNEAGSWNVRFNVNTLGGNLNTLTAGAITVECLVSDPA